MTTVPDISGVTWRLYPAGEYVEVSNQTSGDLTVLGYEGEPYLRIGPRGVEQNLNSAATYLNARRDADVALPPRVDPHAPPDWRSVSDRSRFAWFDHRVHRMPGSGEWATDPGPWAVPFELEGRGYVLEGRLEIAPGPPWWLPLAAAATVTSIALAGARRTGAERLRPAAGVVVAVALVNLIHIPDEFAALPTAAVDVAFGVLHNVLFIATGLVGAHVAARPARPSGLLLLGASAAVAFHQGFLQLVQLGASQLPTIWPEWWIRAAVAASVTQFVWVLLLVLSPRPTRLPTRGPNGPIGSPAASRT